MSLATHPFVYLGTTPWRPTLSSASEVGIGTDYPAPMNIRQVCEIYWRRQRFTLAVTVFAPTVGTFSCDDIGVNRGAEGIDLITPTGGDVHATTGVIDPVGLTLSGHFTLGPDSKFWEHGVQYLNMVGQAGFSGSGAPTGRITINGPGELIGEASICGIPIPLYGTNGVSGSFVVDGELWT